MLLEHCHSGRRNQTDEADSLFTFTQNHLSYKQIRARRYIFSPIHFNRPVAAVFWKQRKLIRHESLRLCQLGHCHDPDLDVRIGIPSAGMLSSHGVESASVAVGIC